MEKETEEKQKTHTQMTVNNKKERKKCKKSAMGNVY